MHHNSGFIKLVHEAKAEIEETDIATIKRRIDSQDDLLLIDVREESEWMNGHIPTAVHMSKGTIERDVENVISNYDQEVVLYCGGGYRSALAALNLKKMGYRRVKSMDGGIRGWMTAGFDLVDNERT